MLHVPRSTTGRERRSMRITYAYFRTLVICAHVEMLENHFSLSKRKHK